MGALAGSLCTCRQAEYNYCVFADAAGIDCSGFVSRAWGIDKRGTAGYRIAMAGTLARRVAAIARARAGGQS